MATKQHSSGRGSRKPVRSFSKRSDWAAWMNGADPEWLCEREAEKWAEVFDGFFPAWLIESEPWREINGDRFRGLRETMLGLSTEQCAAYLGVHRSTICRWEANELDTPRAAFEALRLISRTANSVVSDKHWDGWFINRQTGALVCPDIGKLEVKPEEIKKLPHLYGLISILEDEVEKQKKQIAELREENTALRGGDRTRQAVIELQGMQERIAGLLAAINTAEVIEFNQPASQERRVA